MKTFKSAFILCASLSAVLGIIYPCVITGIGQLIFHGRANGSLIYREGRIIGSALIGQSFTGPGYFHGRPAAANYDGGASAASNYGPSEPKWQTLVQARIARCRLENKLASGQPIPVELVTASASGLDPHLSLAGALLQVPRIAACRGLDDTGLRAMVAAHVTRPLFGAAQINVLLLNLALDEYDAGRRRVRQ